MAVLPNRYSAAAGKKALRLAAARGCRRPQVWDVFGPTSDGLFRVLVVGRWPATAARPAETKIREFVVPAPPSALRFGPG